MSIYDEIYETAFEDELQKVAAEGKESSNLPAMAAIGGGMIGGAVAGNRVAEKMFYRDLKKRFARDGLPNLSVIWGKDASRAARYSLAGKGLGLAAGGLAAGGLVNFLKSKSVKKDELQKTARSQEDLSPLEKVRYKRKVRELEEASFNDHEELKSLALPGMMRTEATPILGGGLGVAGGTLAGLVLRKGQSRVLPTLLGITGGGLGLGAGGVLGERMARNTPHAQGLKDIEKDYDKKMSLINKEFGIDN